MEIKRITPTFWVSPQILPADLAALAALGVGAIINDRPDGEEAGQPGSAEIAAAAVLVALAVGMEKRLGRAGRGV